MTAGHRPVASLAHKAARPQPFSWANAGKAVTPARHRTTSKRHRETSRTVLVRRGGFGSAALRPREGFMGDAGELNPLPNSPIRCGSAPSQAGWLNWAARRLSLFSTVGSRLVRFSLLGPSNASAERLQGASLDSMLPTRAFAVHRNAAACAACRLRRETASAYLKAAGIAIAPRPCGHGPKPAKGVSTNSGGSKPASAAEVSTDSGPPRLPHATAAPGSPEGLRAAPLAGPERQRL